MQLDAVERAAAVEEGPDADEDRSAGAACLERHDFAEQQLAAAQGDAAGIEEALELEVEAVVLPHLRPTGFQPFPFQASGDSL